MGMEALFQGLQMFQQGLQQYSTSRAIGQATEAVNQLNQSELSAQEKRVAQMQLGNQLAAHLSQLGATGAQIQGATSAIKPEQYGSAQEMYLQGKLTGNEDLVKQAEQLQQWAAAPTLAAEERKFNRDIYLKKMDINADYQKALLSAMSKEGEGNAARGIGSNFVVTDPSVKVDKTEAIKMRDTLNTFESFGKKLQRLKGMVQKYGTESFSVWSNNSSRMENLYKEIILDLKKPELKNLGVLQKIDLEQMEEYLRSPTAFFGTGTKWLDTVDEIEQSLVGDVQSKARSLGGTINPDFFKNAGFKLKNQGQQTVNYQGKTYEGYYLPNGDFQPTREVK